MTTAHDLHRDGLSQREIAERLDIAQSTVSYRLKTVEPDSDHGHRWVPIFDGGTYTWVCPHCTDELPADSPTEAFTYECEAQREEAA